jgi:hypothetical protein
MRQVLEPIHALVYFAPTSRTPFDEAGFKGGWMGYFATRAAPMGPVPADVVIATFFGFAPAMVRRSIPDAWTFSTPEVAIAARYRAADAALRTVLGEEGIGSPEVAEAVELLRRACEGCRPEGRPLYAGHASLPWPTEPHVALWHAATLLREHRGDGHVAALTAAGLDGIEAHVTAVADGRSAKEVILPFRGWTEDDWSAAVVRLRARGLLDGEQLTEAGRTARATIERRTDELAAEPWRRLGTDSSTRLESLLQPVADRILSGGGLPFPNPMGLTRP